MSWVPKDLPDNSHHGRNAAAKASAENDRHYRAATSSALPEVAKAANCSLICLVRLIARQAAADHLKDPKGV